ncbi:hypothetical protein [Streptomyces sp. NPDC101393]|uniref:hypothetical protein n=1 Tax=Streptomyces sp. NPDC101393 TaxID=3366141 RepID=UPI003815799F
MRDADPRIVLGLHRSRHERRLLTGALDLGVTSIDTSSNYLGFRSHEVLARTAGDLLPKFRLPTKVGYFAGPGGAEHTLAPGRLYEAVEKAVRGLGREPDVVFSPVQAAFRTAYDLPKVGTVAVGTDPLPI